MRTKKFIVVLMLTISASILLLVYLANATTSRTRVVQCFDLTIGLLATDSEIEGKLNAKFPKGTLRSEFLAYLESREFHFRQRSWWITSESGTERGIHCMFGGGGLFEVVFREYTISFYFDKVTDALSRITVAYGLTGP